MRKEEISVQLFLNWMLQEFKGTTPLLSGLWVQLDCSWLLSGYECHYCTFRESHLAGPCCGSQVSQLDKTLGYSPPLSSYRVPSGTVKASRQGGGFHVRSNLILWWKYMVSSNRDFSLWEVTKSSSNGQYCLGKSFRLPWTTTWEGIFVPSTRVFVYSLWPVKITSSVKELQLHLSHIQGHTNTLTYFFVLYNVTISSILSFSSFIPILLQLLCLSLREHHRRVERL